MRFNHEEIKSISRKHADDPQPGDYWDEMCVGICVILDRQDHKITLCREKQEFKDGWLWDLEKAEEMTIKEFKEWISYNHSTKDLGFWCDCNPNHHMRFVREWQEMKRLPDYYKPKQQINLYC